METRTPFMPFRHIRSKSETTECGKTNIKAEKKAQRKNFPEDEHKCGNSTQEKHSKNQETSPRNQGRAKQTNTDEAKALKTG